MPELICCGCGASFTRNGYARQRNFYSTACRGRTRAKTEGRRYVRKAVAGRRGVREHREVVEQALSRSLGVDEVVHHVDEDPRNNAIENLEVMSRAKHQAHHRPLSFDIEEAKRMYELGSAFEEVGAALGVHPFLIQAAFVRRGIPRRPAGRRIAWDIDAAYSFYLSGFSMREIGEVLGVGRSSIQEAFQRRGLPVRGHSEATALARTLLMECGAGLCECVRIAPVFLNVHDQLFQPLC